MSDVKETLTPAQELERAALASAIRDMLRGAAGKRVIFWMLEQCGLYRDPDCGEATHATSVVIGEQRVGRKLITMLNSIDPTLYPQLLFDMAEIRSRDHAAEKAVANNSEGEEDE